MPLRVPPKLAQLGTLLRQGGPKATAAARRVMYAESTKIRDLARSNCPVLNHDVLKGGAKGGGIGRHEIASIGYGGPGPLERSIVVEKGYENSGRLQLLVNCGGTEDTDKYALLMEEGLSPYGSGGAGKLGPLSMQKMSAGHDVGGKFMERAANERVPLIPNNILVAVEQAIDEEFDL